jgi:hypothetical protein
MSERISCNFVQTGSLGLELVESPTGHVVLKTRGNGPAKVFNLRAEDVLTEIIYKGKTTYPSNMASALTVLKNAGRPVTLVFIRPNNAQQRQTYLGESAATGGSFGLPPSTQKSRSPRSEIPKAPPKTSRAPVAPTRPSPRQRGSQPIAPKRPSSKRNERNVGAQITTPSQFSVPKRRGGGNTFAIPSRRANKKIDGDEGGGGAKFAIPKRRGKKGVTPSPSSTGNSGGDEFKFNIPTRRKSKTEETSNRVIKSSVIINAPRQARNLDAQNSNTNRLRQQVIPVANDTTTKNVGMYASVDGAETATANKFAVPSRRGGNHGIGAEKEEAKNTKSGFYGAVMAPDHDVGFGATSIPKRETPRVQPSVGRSPSEGDRPPKVDRPARESLDVHTPSVIPSGVTINKPRNSEKSLGRHGSDLFKHVMGGRSDDTTSYQYQPASNKDPPPSKSTGSVASALGGLMNDLDGLVGNVAKSAESRQYTSDSNGQVRSRDKYGNTGLPINNSVATTSITGTNGDELTSWEREARGMGSSSITGGSSGQNTHTSISTKTRIRDPYEITGEAMPLKLTRSMVFGNKGQPGLFGAIPQDEPIAPQNHAESRSGSNGGSSNRAGADGNSVGDVGTGALTVKAIYAFEAELNDELSFGKGAIIYDVTVKDEDWYFGYTKGKKGAFPKEFVKNLPPNSRRAKWAFDAEHDDELSFPKDGVVECIEKKDNDWSWGTYKGKRGCFPSSYLGDKVDSSGDISGRRSGGLSSGSSGGKNQRNGNSSGSSGGYVPGSLSSDSYVPGQFSSESSSSEPFFTSSAPAHSGPELSSLERARMLLGGVQQASEAADAVAAATAKMIKLQSKYESNPSSSTSSTSSTSLSSLSSYSSNNRTDRKSMTALADFEGESYDELTFRKGDEITFVRKHDSDWSIGLHVRSGKEGMYPTNFAR